MNKKLLSLTMSGMLLANSSIASEAMEPQKLKCVGNVVSTAVSNPVKTLLVVGGIIAAPIAAVAAAKIIHRIVKKPNANVEEIKKEVIDNVKKGESVKVEAFSANDAKKFKSEMEASGLKVNGSVHNVPDNATGTFIVMPRPKKEGQPEEFDVRFEVEKPAEVKPAAPKHEVKPEVKPEIKPEVKPEEKRQDAPKKAVKEELKEVPKEQPKEQPKEAPKKIVKEEPKKHEAPAVKKLDLEELLDVKIRQAKEKMQSIEALRKMSEEISRVFKDGAERLKRAREERTGVSDELREKIQESLNGLMQERMPSLSVEEVTGNIKESFERIESDSQEDAERLNQRALEVAREATGDIRLTESPESVAEREHAIEAEARPTVVLEFEKGQEIARAHQGINKLSREAIEHVEEAIEHVGGGTEEKREAILEIYRQASEQDQSIEERDKREMAEEVHEASGEFARRIQEAMEESKRNIQEYERRIQELRDVHEIPVAGIETRPEALARMEEELRLEREQQRMAQRESARRSYERKLRRSLTEEVQKQVNYIMNCKPESRLSELRNQILFIVTRCVPQRDIKRIRTEISTNTRPLRYRLENLLRGEQTGASIKEQMQKLEEILNYAQNYNFNASLAAWEAVH